jgi:DNA polymerase III, alpha subunit (gram-positive type)
MTEKLMKVRWYHYKCENPECKASFVDGNVGGEPYRFCPYCGVKYKKG